MLEVLEDFDSVKLPFEWLVQTCPRLQARRFSIASSPRMHPRQAHITLAVVDYRTPFRRRKRGLCSTWLAGLSQGAASQATVTPSRHLFNQLPGARLHGRTTNGLHSRAALQLGLSSSQALGQWA